MSRALVASFVGKVEFIAAKQFLDGLLVIEPIQVVIVIRIRGNDLVAIVTGETTSFRIGGCSDVIDGRVSFRTIVESSGPMILFPTARGSFNSLRTVIIHPTGWVCSLADVSRQIVSPPNIFDARRALWTNTNTTRRDFLDASRFENVRRFVTPIARIYILTFTFHFVPPRRF